jgi:MOSC domain-containing protein YiiM
MARLLSVNVGLPRDVSWRGVKVFTSVWKESVQGSRKVRRLNVDGDGQGDLSGHGVSTERSSSTRWIPTGTGSSN